MFITMKCFDVIGQHSPVNPSKTKAMRRILSHEMTEQFCAACSMDQCNGTACPKSAETMDGI
jgi:hypothetical protein